MSQIFDWRFRISHAKELFGLNAAQIDDYIDPFGQADCEAEINELNEDGYRGLYFEEIPFNTRAVRRETYLIIGRRGSGKTALAHYFSFQKSIKNPLCIDVDEPKKYKQVLDKISNWSGSGGDQSTTYAEELWTYLIWCLIFNRTKDFSDPIAKACVPCDDDASPTGYLNSAINFIFDTLGTGDERINTSESVTQKMGADEFEDAVKGVINFSKKKQIIVAIDTLEKYNTSDGALMAAVAGLVQAAAKFNNEYSLHGIHIKVFVSGEIFPHLLEGPLSNTLKSVKHPVHMAWRARDLLRLIAWRYGNFLVKNGLLERSNVSKIDWKDPQEVRANMWKPYFGGDIKNRHGYKEDSFSYVLRHTQMRPRQLIVLCNHIAQHAINSGNFPIFSQVDIVEGVRSGEEELALEVFNSYSEVYPNALDIAHALNGLPIVFDGKELDRRAPESARHWINPLYSAASFNKLLIELGIVGKIERDSGDGHFDVEFQYAQKNRLFVAHRDRCAIHPMFYSTLGILKPSGKLVVHPYQFKNEESWMFERKEGAEA